METSKLAPAFANARSAAVFDTHISVRVTLNGQQVTTGSASVTSRTATTPLVFDTSTGKWDATVIGYDEVYIVDVESGSDYVEGVRVDGPDINFSTAPMAGPTLDSTVATPVTWSAEQEAATAAIDAEQIDKLAIPDSRQYMLAAGALKADKDSPRENTNALVGTNRITPAGAIVGSDVRVSVENRVRVIAQPNPAL